MVNKVLLIGHVGNDPKYKALNDQTSVANFSLATAERYKNKNGEKVEKTEWHNIVAWKGLAALCRDYVYKGQKVFIEGKLTYQKYTDKNNIDRIATKIIVTDITFLSPKPGTDGSKPAKKVEKQSIDDVPEDLNTIPDGDMPF